MPNLSRFNRPIKTFLSSSPSLVTDPLSAGFLMAKTLMMLDDGSSQHRYSVVESASAKVPKCQAHFQCGFCNRATYWISPSRFSLFYGSREISVRGRIRSLSPLAASFWSSPVCEGTVLEKARCQSRQQFPLAIGSIEKV